MDAGDCSVVDDKEFWQEIRRLLLSLVCVIERHKLGGPTTAELRKAGKRIIDVDVKKE
jgi:hypothetical protein